MRFRPGSAGVARISAARAAAPLTSSLVRAAIARSRVDSGPTAAARASMGAAPARPPKVASASKASARKPSSTSADRASSTRIPAAASSFHSPASLIADLPTSASEGFAAPRTSGSSLARSPVGLRLRFAAAPARASRAVTRTRCEKPSGMIVWSKMNARSSAVPRLPISSTIVPCRSSGTRLLLSSLTIALSPEDGELATCAGDSAAAVIATAASAESSRVQILTRLRRGGWARNRGGFGGIRYDPP